MKKMISLLLTLAMLCSLCACGGGGKQQTEQSTETPDAASADGQTAEQSAAADASLIPEEELLAGYQAYMTDWMWAEVDHNESLLDVYSELQDCIDQNDYSKYPGTLFFDGSFSIGNAKTYQEYCAEKLGEAAAQAEVDASYIHISTFSDWLNIANDLGGRYILDNDINPWDEEEGTLLEILGSMDHPFTGELNGNGHSITGRLGYTGEEESWALFACNEGSIHDLNLGFVGCDVMQNRFYDFQNESRTLSSLAQEELSVEKTRYYAVLCGCNRGTIENISFTGFNVVPEYNLLNNSNELVDLALICGRNEGTIRGINVVSNDVYLRSMDRDTALNAGIICGTLGPEGVVDQVQMEESDVFIRGWGGTGVELMLSPAVYSGLIAGEVEAGGVITAVSPVENCMVDAEHNLPDVDIRLGGIVGDAAGDLTLSGIDANLSLGLDNSESLEGYEIHSDAPACAGGLIGYARGNVVLSDCKQRDFRMVHTTRNRGGESYAAGFVGFCAGDLSAENVSMTGGRLTINATRRDTCLAGLCGRCNGNVDVKDSDLSASLSFMFGGGKTLYEANLCGYVAGDAVFSAVRSDCGENEGHAGLGEEATYYFASLAACLEGEISVDNCDLTSEFHPVIDKDATYYGALDTDGFYNRPH